MCGIYGYVSSKPQDIDYIKCTDTLFHRGPDDGGYYKDNYVALGHRRLSIIDINTGHQPIFNQDRSKAIIFNGEIYNYKELRLELINKGYKFNTNSDTETILVAYEEWGEECLRYLSGMFSFAIWSIDTRKLFIARDRLGIKPLFYTIYQDTLYFASEIKAITTDSRIPLKINESALVSYFTLSYIPAPNTIFKNIFKLLPGHYMTWNDGNITIKKYWDLNFIPDRTKSEKYFIEGIKHHLHKSVSSHLVSDVPVGAFLSGGVDSSAVVAYMSKSLTHEPVNTYCIGFGGTTGGYLDERVYAEIVSKKYKTSHKQYEVTPNSDGIIDLIIDAFDEPFADDSSIPSHYVSKIASENVKVILSGLGGDELFVGYERYLGFRLQSIYNKIPKIIRKNIIYRFLENIKERQDGHYTINHMKRFARGSLLSPDQCYFSYMSVLDQRTGSRLFNNSDIYNHGYDECSTLITNYFNSTNVHGDANSIDRALYTDIKTYLPDDILALSDRISMYHSLEVRVPFIDHEFVEFTATIPPEMKIKYFKKKYLLKKSVKNDVPKEVLNHRKQGFVGPTSKWLQNEMKDYVITTLSSNKINMHGFLNPDYVETILDEHFSRRNMHDKLIWSLVIFQKWFEKNQNRLS